MRSAFLCIGILLIVCSGQAQTDPTAEGRKRLNNRLNQTPSTGSRLIPQTPQQKVVYITYLTQDREWTADDDRKMTGKLVAFSAPRPGEKGDVEVIRDGKIRLRPTGSKTHSDFPIEKLSSKDLLFIRALEAGIRRAREREKAAAVVK